MIKYYDEGADEMLGQIERKGGDVYALCITKEGQQDGKPVTSYAAYSIEQDGTKAVYTCAGIEEE